MDVKVDYPNPGKSTCFYKIESKAIPSITRITFGLCEKIILLDAGIWNGTSYTARLIPKGGLPKPSSFPSAPKGDPTTGLRGLKFDLHFGDRTTRYHYFTVNGNYVPEDMLVKTTSESRIQVYSVTGPSRSCLLADPSTAKL